MPLFRPAGTNFVAVADLAAAASWYADIFGLRPRPAKFEGGEKGFELYGGDELFFVLGPSGLPTNDETPMLYTRRIDKARKYLIEHGVTIGETQRDRQNTRFFEMRDLEGNVTEIVDEP
jgi:catechol 2,3-dioxygenase-like lactoylglutathione lyase family enzyme